MPTDSLVRAVAPILTALALGVACGATASGQTEAESLSTSFRKAARRVLPALVTVRPLGVAVPNPLNPLPPGGLLPPGPRGPLPDGPAEEGGSGVVIDADKGYILT